AGAGSLPKPRGGARGRRRDLRGRRQGDGLPDGRRRPPADQPGPPGGLRGRTPGEHARRGEPARGVGRKDRSRGDCHRKQASVTVGTRVTDSVATVRAHADRLLLARTLWRRVPVVLVIAAIAFTVAYILFITQVPPEIGGGSWRTTTFGSAVHDPGS